MERALGEREKANMKALAMQRAGGGPGGDVILLLRDPSLT